VIELQFVLKRTELEACLICIVTMKNLEIAVCGNDKNVYYINASAQRTMTGMDTNYQHKSHASSFVRSLLFLLKIAI
jgi:hypothetical protein